MMENRNGSRNNIRNRSGGSKENPANRRSGFQMPEIPLPKGGGAIKGISEEFRVNAANGTSSMSLPLPLSPSRQGFIPTLNLSYDSGSGNSPFGLGWDVNIASISRRTDRQLPRYRDEEESDTFMLSGSEDLVPYLEYSDGGWQKDTEAKDYNGSTHTVTRYRPRIEGGFTRIEKWLDDNTGDTFWVTTGADNVRSYYGLTEESRISHPEDSTKTFRWLLSHSYDDKGNIILYRYKKEDFKGIPKSLYEKNRQDKCTQTYIKKILYGNGQPFHHGDALPAEDDFLFMVVFDYGEHDSSEAIPKDVDIEKNDWDCREDAFSSCRAGFEQRTYRQCRRVMLFHCFSSGKLPHSPYLVKSMDLHHSNELKLGAAGTIGGFSFTTGVRQNGHKWDNSANRYLTKSLPDFEFDYQAHQWDTEIHRVSSGDSIYDPTDIDDRRYQWVDLYSEGISGILSEQTGGWYYMSNLGGGQFSKASLVAPRPNAGGLATGLTSIQEIASDGIKYLVRYGDEPKGYYKLSAHEKWEPFRSFEATPNIDFLDPNLRMLDLTGDGTADLLITEEDVLRWYPGAGEKGFEQSETVFKQIDEENGPAILFEDRTQSIFLADMNGDGLTDILRIRNGEVCYWPNLGWGNFGSKITMENSPVFDYPDTFNPGNIRLADIDGTGTVDIIYLGRNDFRVWLNLNGNSLTEQPVTISPFPSIDNIANVSVLDFLGTGTACIVYASPLKQTLQYIDLMGSKKPHLMTGFQNNCGKEVRLEYRTSTDYYLEDKKEGRSWITRLPFPVHCLAKVRSEDKIAETVFINSYRYSHGYFDSAEREFRGFARVEQLDTEEFSLFKINEASNVVDEELHQPPVKTVSWFHTGAYLENSKLVNQCRDEYFQNTLFTEYELPKPLINDTLTSDELREALGAFKGLTLRSEVYSDDDSSLSQYPYSAAQSTYEIRLLQPKSGNKYACFQILLSESISYAYERNPADPRMSQTFILDTDEMGNPTRTAQVIYPRVSRPVAPDDIPDIVWQEQSKLHVSYAETDYSGDIIEDDVFRLRVPYESRSYEISGINPSSGNFFSLQEIAAKIAAAVSINYEDEFSSGAEKRLLGHSRIYFANDTLDGARSLGELSPLGIAHKNCRLAFTPGLVSKYYGSKVTESMLETAGYVHSEGDDNWWIPSGTAIYEDDPADNFYAPGGGRDIFGNESYIGYDDYTLLVESATDAIGDKVQVQNDYRTLSAVMITDKNLNRTAATTDELGFIIKTALMGKEGDGEGDTIEEPTSSLEYDLLNWRDHGKPNYVHTFVREEHGDPSTRWQESYVYSDGGGNIIMAKIQAKPGKAKQWNSTAKTIEEVDADPRWIGNGRTILNNKGNPVKQYQPYFSTTYEYESEDGLVAAGVTPVAYYDPLGRNIRTENPDGTFTMVEFNSWAQKSFDVNDTVKDSQWYIDRGSPDPDTDPEPSEPDERAAWLTAKHHGTPDIVHGDSIGRPFYTVTDHGAGKETSVYSESDFSGRYIRIYDQLARKVSEAYSSPAGLFIYGKSAEKGEYWTFSDAMGRPAKIWDNSLREFRTTYDNLHRPVSTFFTEDGAETLFGHVVYGDILADAAQKNMRGVAYQIYDQSGVVTVKEIDFKGNPLNVERRLVSNYSQTINWQALEGLATDSEIDSAAASWLETEVFTTSAVLDALNRPVLVTLADNSVVEPEYNESNMIDTLRIKIRGQGNFVTFLAGQDYDAKGQRQYAEYGNGLITNYFYDPDTFRLINLITKPVGASDSQSLQNLSYNYDPVGNITFTGDNAQSTYFFKNAVIKPEYKYEYDAVYRMVTATGREHAGLGGNTQRDYNDLPYLTQLPHANEAGAVRNYTEQYQYDDCGNITSLKHIASGADWTQLYRYEYQDDPTNNTNRLKSTSLPGDAEAGPYSAPYQHDLHGNMLSMPHLAEMVWDFADRLRKANLGGGGMAYYVYGLMGNRARKVIERLGGLKTEHIYVGPVEIYRKYLNGTKKLERSTLHVSDGTGRIAQVDSKIVDTDDADTANPLNVDLIRYQFTNHLGSATLETDDLGNVVSYEEYHPFGTSAYRSSKSDVDLSLKRYRFANKEMDDETGFYYFGARYYAAWLGRWTSADPAGFADGLNLFAFARNNPVTFVDIIGTQSGEPTLVKKQKVTGKESFEDLQKLFGAAPPGWKFDPTLTKDNFKSRWMPGKGWNVYVTDEPTPQVGEGDVAGGAKGDEPASPTPAPPSPVEMPPEPPATPSTPEETAGSAASVGAPSSLASPGGEKFIWEYGFEGPRGTQRGRILEWMYGNKWRDTKKGYDVETATEVKQIKSTDAYDDVGKIARSATRDAAAARTTNPSGTMAGKRAQAVLITPTDAPAYVDTDISSALNPGAGRKIPANATPPEHVRGLPGKIGAAGRGLTVAGTALSAFALGYDLGSGDYSMASGDALSTLGGGMEIYALATPGATVAGVSVMTAGLAVGGLGIAVTSGISGYRAYQAGDTAGAVAGGVGVGAGLAITAGAIGIVAGVAAAPVVLAVGIVAAIGVGVFHVGRYFDWW